MSALEDYLRDVKKQNHLKKSFFSFCYFLKNRWKSQRIKISKGICSDLRLLKFRAWNSWHFDRRRFYKFEVRIIYILKGKKIFFLKFLKNNDTKRWRLSTFFTLLTFDRPIINCDWRSEQDSNLCISRIRSYIRCFLKR